MQKTVVGIVILLGVPPKPQGLKQVLVHVAHDLTRCACGKGTEFGGHVVQSLLISGRLHFRVPCPGNQEGSRFQVEVRRRSPEEHIPVSFDVRLSNIPDSGPDARGQERLVAVREGFSEERESLGAGIDEVPVNLPDDAWVPVGEQVDQRFDACSFS